MQTCKRDDKSITSQLNSRMKEVGKKHPPESQDGHFALRKELHFDSYYPAMTGNVSLMVPLDPMVKI
jgi:hypothetical protein